MLDTAVFLNAFKTLRYWPPQNRRHAGHHAWRSYNQQWGGWQMLILPWSCLYDDIHHDNRKRCTDCTPSFDHSYSDNGCMERIRRPNEDTICRAQIWMIRSALLVSQESWVLRFLCYLLDFLCYHLYIIINICASVQLFRLPFLPFFLTVM